MPHRPPGEPATLRAGLSVAALYLLLGAIGLTLAIPPGYASPIFPAAGLALAAVLRYGRGVLPFVWLGSFGLNIAQAFVHSQSLSLASGVAATCIATGATLQAALGHAWVIRRMGTAWQRLASEASILAFLFLGGLLACLSSASIAVGTLWGLGLIEPQAIGFSWWTWYTGDLLGTAIFAPLALLYLLPRSELSVERRKRIVVPIVIALGLSMVLYAVASQTERRQMQAQFEQEAAAVAKRIQDRLNAHQVVLSSLSHFAEANPEFTYRQFRTFTQAILQENPDLFALSFNDLVPRAGLAAYEAQVSRLSPLGKFRVTERGPDMTLVRAGERPDYVVVRYILPLEGNAPAVGFDINSEPLRRDAIARARASGRVAVTAPVRLVQELGVRMGVLALDPVPVPGRAGEIAGFAVAVIKVDQLVRIAAGGQVPPGMNFTVADGAITDQAQRFFSSAPDPAAPAVHRWKTRLTLADRQWDLEFQGEAAYANQRRHWVSWGVGVIALLFTGLLQIYLHGMTGRAHAIRQQNANLLAKQSELQLAETVFENTAEALVVLDPGGLILSVNPSFTHITGYSLAEVRGQSVDILSQGQDAPSSFQDLRLHLARERNWQGEVVHRRRSGELFTALSSVTAVTDAKGVVVHYVQTFSDITENKEALSRIEFLAYHDALTELPNRLLGRERANEAIARARRHGDLVGVLFLDLDHFKLVNDTYGHSVGDKLLQAVAHRLRVGVRSQDTVCRISGDEFMLILERVKAPEDIAAVCSHLLASVAEPFPIDGRLIQTSLSVGISMYPADGDSTEDLLRKADTAMFEAKQAGRSTFRFFDQAMNRSVVEFVETRDLLSQALRSGQFELYYQPQIRLSDGEVVGVEALIRWHHPTQGLVGPDHIISVAEQSGLIVPIGEWVLQQACRQMKAWVDQGLPMQTMAVNLSVVQFRTGHIEMTVKDALSATGLPAGRLELEITETVLIGDKDKMLDRIAHLRALGVRLSIDDFGTGYSSMAYLKRLQVDKLKIDSSFVGHVASDPGDAAIVRSIIQIAQALGLETTAEGVEHPQTAEALGAMGCLVAQGFHYARPMPQAQFEDWLRTRLEL